MPTPPANTPPAEIGSGPRGLQVSAYGVDFAKFLAALIPSRDWRLTAEIKRTRDGRADSVISVVRLKGHA